ncbi:unnamed protein product [Arabis nemorensis]|uniref:Uncharacterized protein n=1 Tax=Arabis nemorensis TaxID=586526 RepID=A0A565AZQ2_9BRAS|nr:unnamed protein product [Arabis nemorensis]
MAIKVEQKLSCHRSGVQRGDNPRGKLTHTSSMEDARGTRRKLVGRRSTSTSSERVPGSVGDAYL